MEKHHFIFSRKRCWSAPDLGVVHKWRHKRLFVGTKKRIDVGRSVQNYLIAWRHLWTTPLVHAYAYSHFIHSLKIIICIITELTTHRRSLMKLKRDKYDTSIWFLSLAITRSATLFTRVPEESSQLRLPTKVKYINNHNSDCSKS